jgi:hypothetical protein
LVKLFARHREKRWAVVWAATEPEDGRISSSDMMVTPVHVVPKPRERAASM